MPSGTLTFQPGQSLFYGHVDFALLGRSTEIQVNKSRSILLTALLGKREDNDGQKILFLEVTDQVHVNVPVLLLE